MFRITLAEMASALCNWIGFTWGSCHRFQVIPQSPKCECHHWIYMLFEEAQKVRMCITGCLWNQWFLMIPGTFLRGAPATPPPIPTHRPGRMRGAIEYITTNSNKQFMNKTIGITQIVFDSNKYYFKTKLNGFWNNKNNFIHTSYMWASSGEVGVMSAKMSRAGLAE